MPITKKTHFDLCKIIHENTANEFFSEEFERKMQQRLNPIIFRDPFLTALCDLLQEDNPLFKRSLFLNEIAQLGAKRDQNPPTEPV